jgi:potassium/hydrogen antiporter
MNALIISLCVMLLLAYLTEISSERTKIPAVIIMLFMGWLTKEIIDFLQLNLPDLEPVLPFLGTIGLILIVLEGAMELKINRSKLEVVSSTLIMAVVQIIVLAGIFSTAFYYIWEIPFQTALLNALPLCVISSSIAIPSAKNISSLNREFVIYESSFSDILGVLFFNFILINQSFNFTSVGLFLLQILLISLISLFSVIGLSYLLSRIKHQITYTPIILLVILIYAVAKEFDLSGLLFILVFGMFLGNFTEIRKFFLVETLVERLDSARLGLEIIKFKGITIEATFIVRSLFFLLLGFVLETGDFINLQTLPLATGIVIILFGMRWILLKSFKLPVSPLLYFTPRGLISILLFLSILPDQNIPLINNSLMVQIIILSVLVMTSGLLIEKNKSITS